MKFNYLNNVLLLVAVSTLLLGISILLIGYHSHIQIITDFYSITEALDGDSYNAISSIAFITISLLALISVSFSKTRKLLGSVLIVISTIPLFALFGQAMWIESMGGFPAIGSGQGVIKYAALFAIGFYLLDIRLNQRISQWVAISPVLLVLLWIGGMKFTLLEAQGIEALVASSPLMSWMYSIWDLQTASNLIGVYDLIAIALLIIAIYQEKFLLPSVIMSGTVFMMTQTFLFTWHSALDSQTLLSTGGHFLIKDVWFIANLIIFWHVSKQ